MFDKIAEYSEIGNYLEKLITKKYKETGDKRYKNVSQFCKACLEEEGMDTTGDEPRKKSQYFSGMKNENKEDFDFVKLIDFEHPEKTAFPPCRRCGFRARCINAAPIC